MFKNFAKNIVLSGFSEFTTVFLFVLFIFAARQLGDEQFGVFMFAMAFVGLFEIINDLGLKNLLVREVARNKQNAKEFIGNAVTVSVFLSGIGLFLVVIMPTAKELNAQQNRQRKKFTKQQSQLQDAIKDQFNFKVHSKVLVSELKAELKKAKVKK